MKEEATFELVCQAAEQLESDSQEATILKVKNLLGFGSPNTIQKHLNRRRSMSTTTASRPIPPDIKAAHDQMLMAIWSRLECVVEAEISALREALTDTKSRFARSEEELIDEVERVSQLCASLENENNALKDDIQRLTQDLASSRGVIAYQASEVQSLTLVINGLNEQMTLLKLKKEERNEQLGTTPKPISGPLKTQKTGNPRATSKPNT